MKKFIAIVVVILIAVMAFFYYGTYSEGVRAGTIIKISKRGTIFKTWEGQLNVNAFGAVKGKGTLNESFEFSIPNDSALINKVENLTGQPVKLYYKEKYFLFPWLGETKYLVSDVKPSLDASHDAKETYPRK
ncbi:MAG: 6-phosphogluconate dehydrogenase [Salibacteraceae bacterium]